MRVLIADDDEEFRESLAHLLRSKDHTSTVVSSVADAVTALEREEFEVLFTDLQVGHANGMDLLAAVRQRWPRVNVVMLTGQATVETAVRALHLGAFDYLRKPVEPSQVAHVLELVSEQLKLVRSGARPLDPVQYAKDLATRGGYEVLLISPPPVRLPSTGRVVHLPLDPDNPFRIREAVEDFVAPRPRPAVVLAPVEQLLARHREEEIAELLTRIRELLEGKGPLAVGYDPKKITATGALAVRSSIVSADSAATLDALASPIRRLVLHRLTEGSSTFSQAMDAAHLTDTSKIAFHLRKLVNAGLVAHYARQRYRLTERGRGAIEVLASIDGLDSGVASGNRVFPTRPRRRRSRFRGRPTARSGTRPTRGRLARVGTPAGSRAAGFPC
ncbi:MAG TPA: response regulator [Thermoplasmata archaeon]|nr:response regulator [Thermoplasmata archaeon]